LVSHDQHYNSPSLSSGYSSFLTTRIRYSTLYTMSSGTVSKPQPRRKEALLYLAHPAFFPGAFESQPLLVLDSGTASVHSMAGSEYSLRDLDYDPYTENAISPDPFPSAYEFEFARNVRLRKCEADLLSCLIPVASESLEDGCDAIQSVVSGTENERVDPATARDHLPTNRYEVRKLAMVCRRRVLIQFGEDPEKPLPVPKKAVHSRIELPPHLMKRLVHRSKSHGTYFGIRSLAGELPITSSFGTSFMSRRQLLFRQQRKHRLRLLHLPLRLPL
ncbi:hypothetical protein BZA77DRAFT_377059, partial [Pyronema omphalodes]